IFTFLPTGLFALHQLFAPPIAVPGAVAIGLIGMAAIAITIYCTAMIYASLRPIHAWCNGYVPAGYLLLALVSGLLLLNALLAVFGATESSVLILTLVLLAAGLAFKIAYWRFIDGTKSASTPESATGLGEFGAVRLVEAPHTEANYLLEEMGFKVAPELTRGLRRISLSGALTRPFVLIAAARVLGGGWSVGLRIAAVVSGGIGLVTGRWLFFAEARHTVGLYYGAPRA